MQGTYPNLPWLGFALVALLFTLKSLWWPKVIQWSASTTELEDAGLVEEIEQLGERAGVRLNRVLVLEEPDDEEDAEPERNAMVAGLGRWHAVYVTRGLLDAVPRRLVLAISAHELAHVARHHTLKITALAGAIFAVVANFDAVFGRWPEPVQVLALALVVVAWPLSVRFAQRRSEYEADALAASWVGPLDLAAALEAIQDEENRATESLPWWRRLLATHPPLGLRVERLVEVAKASAESLHPERVEVARVGRDGFNEAARVDPARPRNERQRRRDFP